MTTAPLITGVAEMTPLVALLLPEFREAVTVTVTVCPASAVTSV
jgi:uncharacterized membrane protein